MGDNLINRRDKAMDKANKALDAVWPERKGEDFVRTTLWAVNELETIAAEMHERRFDLVEQSRTYRHLGGLYADLEPALGGEMLLKAKKTYQTAETLLENQSDNLERAKLNFNFGNTLRHIDPNDIDQLREAKQRLLAARAYFIEHTPQYLAQVDAALESVEGLLRIAPLANAVKRNMYDMAILQEQSAAGGDVGEIADKAHEIMQRDGGAAGMVGQVQAIIDTLSEDQRQGEKFEKIQKQMHYLTTQVLDDHNMSPDVKQIWDLLSDRLKSETHSGVVTNDRNESLSGMLEEFGRILANDEKDINSLLAKLQRMREFIEDKFEIAHYLSHGIKRPPVNSRAAKLVELNWQLRRYLLEEMNRPEKGEEESKEALELSTRASRVDKRIYEAGTDETLATTVEKEEIRPLALAIRNFSARIHGMPAKPIWRVASVPVDTNAVFYSGSKKMDPSISTGCYHSMFEFMAEPKGEIYASARWKQLQRAFTAVFDLRVKDGPEMASVTYELGIALTLGKPIVILVAHNQTMPFDVDIVPILLPGGPQDGAAIATAIDQSVVWTYPVPQADTSSKTLKYVLSMYTRPQQNVYVDQTLRMLEGFRKIPDPLAITRTLVKFFDYLKDGETMLIQPRWSPVYPGATEPRLFHVMPFRPEWADRVTTVTREVCDAAHVKYIRGDEVTEQNVIQSIWEEIAGATHILVDLTGFNPNVALELGIAHTLGKNVLMVGQENTINRLFPSIQKLRIYEYSVGRFKQTMAPIVEKFLYS